MVVGGAAKATRGDSLTIAYPLQRGQRLGYIFEILFADFIIPLKHLKEFGGLTRSIARLMSTRYKNKKIAYVWSDRKAMGSITK